MDDTARRAHIEAMQKLPASQYVCQPSLAQIAARKAAKKAAATKKAATAPAKKTTQE